MKILLVEDEPKLASFIQKGFQQEGYDLEVAYDGLVGQRMLNNTAYEVAILDVNLPHVNGYQLCRALRMHGQNTPVLMLTALDNIEDKAAGFDAGADDYLVKPFEFRELLLRVRALTKRAGYNEQPSHLLRLADLELDIHAKVVRRQGVPIALTHREYSLLEYLLRAKGRVVSKVELAEKVWDCNFDSGSNVIEVYVNYLRKKIDRTYSPKLLHTVFGFGYQLREGDAD